MSFSYNKSFITKVTNTVYSSYCTSSYRYGFNDMESDDEVKTDNNSYDFGARMYDPRIGRFISIDRFDKQFPNQSPYCFAGDTPIWMIDKNGDYPVALHYVITYRVMINLGFSVEIAEKVAHYSSVYADHPDWSLFKGAMYNMNVNLMKENGLDPKEMDYKKDVNYDKTKDAQSDFYISSVSIHAMRTYWEDITPKEAVKRALYGGEFLAKDGKTKINIEGAYNVVKRLSKIPIEEFSEDQLKELGVALHTIQDAQVHLGKRWVDKHKDAAEELGNENEHPNQGCINGHRAEEAIQKTTKQLRKIKHKKNAKTE